MIWTRQQVAMAEGFRASCSISKLMLERASINVAAQAREDLQARLVRMGEEAGLLIDPEDVQVQQRAAEGKMVHGLVYFEAAWDPGHTRGLLIGGPCGGKHIAMDPHNHRYAIQVYIQPTEIVPPIAAPDLPLEQARIEPRIYTYHWEGWSETARAWVYRGPAWQAPEIDVENSPWPFL